MAPRRRSPKAATTALERVKILDLVTPVVDSSYAYEGLSATGGRCRLRLYAVGAAAVAIATELADNPGTSITNAAPIIAAQVARNFRIDPARLVWVEHYGPESYGVEGEPDRFARVTFSWEGQEARGSEWAHLPDEELAELLGVATLAR